MQTTDPLDNAYEAGHAARLASPVFVESTLPTQEEREEFKRGWEDEDDWLAEQS